MARSQPSTSVTCCWPRYGGCPRGSGAAYDPATKTWEVLPPVPGGGDLVPVDAVWSGGPMIIVATRKGGRSGAEGARTLVFDPAAGTWAESAGPPMAATNARLAATAAGPVAVSVLLGQPRAARFDLSTGRWAALPGPQVPAATICPTTLVALGEPAVSVAVALPACAGALAQLVDESTGTWVPLPSWGVGLGGVTSFSGRLLVLWEPPGTGTRRPGTPGGAPRPLRVLVPS